MSNNPCANITTSEIPGVDHNWRENPIGAFDVYENRPSYTTVHYNKNKSAVTKVSVTGKPCWLSSKTLPSQMETCEQGRFVMTHEKKLYFQRLGLSPLPRLPRRRRPNCLFINFLGTRMPSHQTTQRSEEKTSFLPSDSPTEIPTIPAEHHNSLIYEGTNPSTSRSSIVPIGYEQAKENLPPSDCPTEVPSFSEQSTNASNFRGHKQMSPGLSHRSHCS